MEVLLNEDWTKGEESHRKERQANPSGQAGTRQVKGGGGEMVFGGRNSMQTGLHTKENTVHLENHKLLITTGV